MAIGSGISGQIGVKAETVYGTPATVDRFWEFVSEGIKDDIIQIDAPMIGGGRHLRADRTKTVFRGARGPIEFVVLNKGFGLLFQHMLGQDTITGAGADKTHTCIPDALAQQGKSLTVQVGRPDIAGVVQPYTYSGGKILDWEIKCALDEPLKVTPTLDFAGLLTSTALAAASYTATEEMFIFSEGALTIGGATMSVKSCSLKGNNSLAGERRFLGNTKKEPLANGYADISGSLEMEHESLDRHTAWRAGTQAQLVLTFTLATLIPTTAIPFSLTITIPKIQYTGDTPNVGGPDVVMQGAPFRALYDGATAPITILMINGDTAA